MVGGGGWGSISRPRAQVVPGRPPASPRVVKPQTPPPCPSPCVVKEALMRIHAGGHKNAPKRPKMPLAVCPCVVNACAYNACGGRGLGLPCPPAPAVRRRAPASGPAQQARTPAHWPWPWPRRRRRLAAAAAARRPTRCPRPCTASRELEVRRRRPRQFPCVLQVFSPTVGQPLGEDHFFSRLVLSSFSVSAELLPRFGRSAVDVLSVWTLCLRVQSGQSLGGRRSSGGGRPSTLAPRL